MARKEIFNFLFSYMMTNKDIPAHKTEEVEEEKIKSGEVRKGRTIALKKLQAAKQNKIEKLNLREELEVRILGLLGRLGGISHQIVSDETSLDSKETSNKVDFLEIMTNKTSGLQFNVNVEGFGIQIRMKTILNRIIELSEHDEHKNDKDSIARELLTCKIILLSV